MPSPLSSYTYSGVNDDHIGFDAGGFVGHFESIVGQLEVLSTDIIEPFTENLCFYVAAEKRRCGHDSDKSPGGSQQLVSVLDVFNVLHLLKRWVHDDAIKLLV